MAIYNTQGLWLFFIPGNSHLQAFMECLYSIAFRNQTHTKSVAASRVFQWHFVPAVPYELECTARKGELNPV